ncbi:MAG TPA: haloacid dehalogenase-like hydrolase [Nanoarchaeota archaeon]|nr:haloacid dehalogenase-like hydrolase [Candidatus Woesearchaeota archaeon]HIH14656.1 haloacid dehalogenase-like hydrolase [Nanoarchaeota archaeon]HIH59156.1 haloacid dehalogenase-like hydrolase [Nanoarchaeota archaeon]HII14166.1 haloacid dehalogenase-like hydrolase [Nanoarchaeota archaeon]HIJ05617.1 haloacid dehalogenase-like hydrolase [Nanoarchaeota archaeon]
MTEQPLANRNIFLQGNRSAYDLIHALANRDIVTQRILCDIDGTLHKGYYDKLLRGISNADLALYLLPRIPFSQFPRFVTKNIEIFLYDRKTLANGIPDAEREIHTKHLVNLFLDSLREIPEEIIQEGAKKLPKRIYPHAKETLDLIHGRRALISCSLQIVADAYGEYVDAREVFGNPLSGKDFKQYGMLYGVQDKERIARMVSHKTERMIVIGDTTDDTGMAVVAHERNLESVVIAMHHRSEALEAKADIIAYSWEDLRAFLEEY